MEGHSQESISDCFCYVWLDMLVLNESTVGTSVGGRLYRKLGTQCSLDWSTDPKVLLVS